MENSPVVVLAAANDDSMGIFLTVPMQEAKVLLMS
jgi:hypothetical protein